jgi:hypothetical protein
MARPYLSSVLLLPDEPREPLRCAALHGVSDQWRLCRLRRCRGGLLLSATAKLHGRGGCAAVVRGADRPSRVAHDGRCQDPRYLWIWRGSAHCGSGCAIRAAVGLCYAPRGFPGPGVRPQSRLRVGGRLRPAPWHRHGCGDHLRARRRPRTQGTRKRSAKAASSSLAVST